MSPPESADLVVVFFCQGNNAGVSNFSLTAAMALMETKKEKMYQLPRSKSLDKENRLLLEYPGKGNV